MTSDDASLADAQQIIASGIFARETFEFGLKNDRVGTANSRALTTARLKLVWEIESIGI